jgi:hypothetical protein
VTGRRKALIVANDEYAHPGLKRLLAASADADALTRVLGDPQIGDFEVEEVRNSPAHVVQEKVADLFSEGRRDDVLLLHFSCHGLKSESGELFFAAQNTDPTRLRATAVSADFVERCMRDSRSRSVILFLDCCFGGAFSQGVTVRASGDVNALDSFRSHHLARGRGRAVITASSAMEYAFEADVLAEVHQEQPSVFTGALVEGLTTGDADLDEDGLISLDELYDYVFERVRERSPHQTPSRDIEMQGDLVIAYSRRGGLRPDTTTVRGAEQAKARQPAAAPLVRVGHHASQSVRPLVNSRAGTDARRRWPMPHGGRLKIFSVIAGAAALAIAVVTIGLTTFHGGGSTITPLPEDQMVAPEKTPISEASNLRVIDTSPIADTFLMGNAEKPTLSPDRTHILFTRKDDASSIPKPYIMDVSGENLHNFVQQDSDAGECTYSDRPAWSNSGNYVAMVCLNADTGDPYSKIFVFNKNGYYQSEIPIDGVPKGFLTWVHSNSIVFVEEPRGSEPGSSLWQLEDIFGDSPPAPVELTKTWKEGSYDLPDWSNSNGLLFQRKNSDEDPSGRLGLWSMDTSDKPLEAKPKGKRADLFRGAAWSPSGHELVFWWLPDKHNQRLSTAANFDELNLPDRWHLLLKDLPTRPGDEPPAGKAQPAWGTL